MLAVQTEVGAGRQFTLAGLDARISLAQLYVNQARDDKALEQLALVQADDPAYRLDEVNALIIEAGGTVELPVDESAEAPSPAGEASVTDEALSADDVSSEDETSLDDN